MGSTPRCSPSLSTYSKPASAPKMLEGMVFLVDMESLRTNTHDQQPAPSLSPQPVATVAVLTTTHHNHTTTTTRSSTSRRITVGWYCWQAENSTASNRSPVSTAAVAKPTVPKANVLVVIAVASRRSRGSCSSGTNADGGKYGGRTSGCSSTSMVLAVVAVVAVVVSIRVGASVGGR